MALMQSVDLALLKTFAGLGLGGAHAEDPGVKEACEELSAAIGEAEETEAPLAHPRLLTGLKAFREVAHLDAGWERASVESVVLPVERASLSIARRLRRCMQLVDANCASGGGMPKHGDNLYHELYERGAGELSQRFFHLFSDLYEAKKSGRADYFIAGYNATEEGAFAETIGKLGLLEEVKFVKKGSATDRHQMRYPELYESLTEQARLVEAVPTCAFVLFFEVLLPGNRWFHFFFRCSTYNMSWTMYPRKTVEKVIDLEKNVVKNKSRACWSCKKLCASCKKCSGCGLAAYCSRECQKKDWGRHKAECGAMP